MDLRLFLYVSSLLYAYVMGEDDETCGVKGDLRLVDGQTKYEGRVEICLGGVWGTICDDMWGASDAKVACLQLGLPSEYAEAIYQFGGGTSSILYSDFHCSGNETLLEQCSVGKNSSLYQYPECYHYEDAGVRCTNTPCIENTVRVDEEIVKVCHNQQWGFVCESTQSWDDKTANFVCDLIGISSKYPRSLRTSRMYYDGPVFLIDAMCTGGESLLVNCSKVGYGEYASTCTHIAIAHCEAQDPCNVTNSIRLTQFDSDLKGRLEICSDGIWGSVCEKGVTDALARVVCRELNYAAIGTVNSELSTDDLLPTVPIQHSNVVCIGNETSIAQCSIAKADVTCRHENDIIVTCLERECEEGEVRLTEGQTSYDGRVEICLDGRWGSVCHNFWDVRDAQVVCRQLRFDGPSYPLLSYPGRDASLFHLGNMLCNGTETNLSECKHRYVNVKECGTELGHAGAICTNVTCDDGTVYLVGGYDVSNGKVIYCYNGTWYSVCAKQWDNNGLNARALCQELGYTSESVIVSYSRGISPVLPFSFSCTSNSSGLSFCQRTALESYKDCSELAGVICNALCHQEGYSDCKECESREECKVESSPLQSCNCYSDCYTYGDCCNDVSNCLIPECETGDVRLVGGVINSTGRLEVCGNGVWGRVCNRHQYWGPDNARVICRQLGFSDEGAYVVGNVLKSVFGTSDKSALVGEIHCIGTEAGWLQCYHTSIGRHSCGPESPHVDDVIISCFDERSCNKGDVRLVDGANKSSGHVEYCHHRTWIKICTEDWGENDAKVICHQLDLTVDDVAVKAFVRGNESAVYLNGLQCSGVEVRLDHCKFTIDEVPSCKTAGVICYVTPNAVENINSTNGVAGATVGVIILILFILTVLSVVAAFVFYMRNKKKKLIQRVTLDIMPSFGTSSTTDVRYTEAVNQDQRQHIKSKEKANNTVGIGLGFQAVHDRRPRAHSYQVRELTRGNFLVLNKDITLLECIGEGEFGIVYKAKVNSAGQKSKHVAVKTLKGTFDQEAVEKFIEESLKMSRFRHAHVMDLIGVCLDAGSAPLIVMPLMANGSLLSYLKSHRDSLVMSEENEGDEINEVCKRLMAMCCQIASGMEYLSDEKYIHRDLAARNCMIDLNFVIKITDFGLSEDIFERNYFHQGSHEDVVKLPVKWMAPESLSDGHFSEKSDVWSYGVTMWEIFSGGKAPYPGVEPLSLIKSLEDGYRMPSPSNYACNNEIYGMIIKCWEMSPIQRPSFKDIHSNISQYIGHIGGYMDMRVNPFSH